MSSEVIRKEIKDLDRWFNSHDGGYIEDTPGAIQRIINILELILCELQNHRDQLEIIGGRK